MDNIKNKTSDNFKFSKACLMLRPLYKDMLDALEEINIKLIALTERIDNIELKMAKNFEQSHGRLQVIDYTYNIDISKFPSQIHCIFKKEEEYYFCDCRKIVFDDIIDLVYGRLKSIKNLEQIAKIMFSSGVSEEFIVDMIYDQYNGYKTKFKVYDKSMFSYDNPNFPGLKDGTKVGDYYIKNDNFEKYYQNYIDSNSRKKGDKCIIEIGHYYLFLW